jgi:hypothetical protein
MASLLPPLEIAERVLSPDIGNGEYDAARPLFRVRGEFTYGPLPDGWFMRAACLRGKAFLVGYLLWSLYGRKKKRTATLTLPPELLRKWGVSSKSQTLAISELEGAGLIKVQRRRGYLLTVTIVDPDNIVAAVARKEKRVPIN